MKLTEDMSCTRDREWQRTGGSTKKCTTILLTLFHDNHSGVGERPSLRKIGGSDRDLVALGRSEYQTRASFFNPRPLNP